MFAIDFVIAHWADGTLSITGWGVLLGLVIFGSASVR